MINILTPSFAFFSNSLSRRYLGIPGLRKLSSVPYQSKHENNPTCFIKTNRARATNHEYKSYLLQARSHVIDSRSSLAAKNEPIAHANREKGLTPSTSHCAETFIRIGEKLSNRLLPTKCDVAAAFSRPAIHWSIWRYNTIYPL